MSFTHVKEGLFTPIMEIDVLIRGKHGSDFFFFFKLAIVDYKYDVKLFYPLA